MIWYRVTANEKSTRVARRAVSFLLIPGQIKSGIGLCLQKLTERISQVADD
jgi:hypothetical protein